MPRSPSPFELYSEFVPFEDANMRSHTLLAGESLPALAFKYYGSVALWTIIADRNDIADVRRVEPGTALLIPAPPAADSEIESL